jgi:aspartyl-tRNA(Asn)/glutamyl-tRNA(Gln) amidotransferase subunit A
MEHLDLAYRAMSSDEWLDAEPAQLRIGIPEPWYRDAPMDDEIRVAFEGAVESMRALGHQVQPIEMPDTVPSRQLIDAIGQEVTAAHREYRRRGEPYGSAVLARIEVAESVTPEAAEEARGWQTMIRSRFADAFATVDLLVTPTSPARRKVIGEENIGDKSHRTVTSYFSALVNHALHPALALPIVGSGAPPASLQVIGPLRSEAALIEFGKSLDAAGITGFTPAPPNSPMTGGG